MVEAVTDEDGDEPLSAQLKAKAQYFTALCGDDANMQLCVLCALERYTRDSLDHGRSVYRGCRVHAWGQVTCGGMVWGNVVVGMR